MEDRFKKLAESYAEGVKSDQTGSGIPIKTVYTPEDVDGFDYDKDLGDPGDYPFTRGIHKEMFKGRYWTKRELCGYGTPTDTNKRLKYLAGEGQGGLNFINDLPTALGIDPDHPQAKGDIGVAGVPLSSLKDMELLMDGIPMQDVSTSVVVSTCSAPVVLAEFIALAENRGIDISRLRGTIQNEPLKGRYCGYGPSTSHIDLCLKTAVDIIEYCTQNMPLWYTMNVNLYDLRENGIDAAQEIAFGFSMAIGYIEKALSRGLKIDEFAPRIAFYCSAHIDFLEEIAKLRAARRLWAKTMKERFGAKDPRSLKFKFGVHTAGCSLVPQQPLNNIIRVAYEALAAVLAGAQSLHCCAYDEPIALPSEDSHRIALRTQQIIAYEMSVANVADPLGGSYYIEKLTGTIEEKAVEIMDKIDEMGGITAAIESKWLDKEIEEASHRFQREVEDKERILVGVNEFTIPPEEDAEVRVHRTPPEAAETQINRLNELKSSRNNPQVKDLLERLGEAAEQKKENLIPYMIDSLKAYATLGEIMGTVREAYGLTYDPLQAGNFTL
ncbi:methylmalonyl-CoA mutase [Thermodesulfobacteriota bacterium]